jgi:hypothetical protein
MDPDEALRNMRDALKRVQESSSDAEAAAELADAAEALDGWLSRGGFLPQDWAGAKR